jgi:carboxylesterase type B
MFAFSSAAMMSISGFIAAVAVFSTLAITQPVEERAYGKPLPATSLTLLYQNNLNFTDDANHVSAILLDPLPGSAAASACAAINEKLLPKSALQAHWQDFKLQLSYQAYAKRVSPVQSYYIQGGVVTVTENSDRVSYKSLPSSHVALPVLCTQSANQSTASATADASNELSVSAGGNTYVGFRNKKSFRFLGIPYADTPQRWVYSHLFSGKGKTIQATAYGSQCAQGGSGSEDCLFLNIQTPYIPKPGSKARLRPVLFWIHGGGFTGGSGADPLTDGGNLASREDLVVVNINYRLSTLGFLAIPGTNIKGNYGIADQIVALQWTINNIANFGGDPHQIVIMGESAGAGSVRTLLGSPKAIGKFQGAVAMSNLGGGVDLGLNGDYGSTYSSYYTIAQSYAAAGQNIFAAAGCNQTSLNDQIACLRKLPALTVVGLSAVARYVVQDGTYVNTENLIVYKRNPNTAHVPVIFGIARDDGASFSTYPKTPVTSEIAGLEAGLGISAAYAQAIIDSGLFPSPKSGNITLDSFNVTSRVATDKTFRCVDEATVYAGAKSGAFKSAYYYEFERTIDGYDPNGVGQAPPSPGYPNGNPNLPYFRVHGADLPWAFGNLRVFRDVNDLYSIQLESGYFSEFVKTTQPNPSVEYLRTRGYSTTLSAIAKTGPWEPVSGKQGPIKKLDYPSVTASFVDVPQCAWLNYSLSYYLEGGK